ncbi:hypothetical protein F5884DRAFT_814652 [Xylogone sp. PMI_703]|nr:hypothetical protein F5884DRAFT_814652 [Xylogone sp. PMI_703]
MIAQGSMASSSPASRDSIPSCVVCRQRKVKCDGRPGTCARCEKLGLECRWQHDYPDISSRANIISSHNSRDITQAGLKRMRQAVACETCRRRKLKCNGGKPTCSSCIKRKLECVYRPRYRRQSSSSGLSPVAGEPSTSHNHDEVESQNSGVGTSRKETRYLGELSGYAMRIYIDSYFLNMHPICINNYMHPGTLFEALDQGTVPPLLLYSLCGVSAKFLSDPDKRAIGRQWLVEARRLIFDRLDHISTLTVVALQLLVLNDIQEGNLTSAWNLLGISIRMALRLKLNLPRSREGDPLKIESSQFLEEECHLRLMWSIFVADLLFGCDESQINETSVALLPTPCSMWNFAQASPCVTFRIHDKLYDTVVEHATNPCAYLIRVLLIRKRILHYIKFPTEHTQIQPWSPSSTFQQLISELNEWRRSLPRNYIFGERSIYAFRSGRQIDMFLMIHVWYHQSRCELYSIWKQFHMDSMDVDVHNNVSSQFIEDCKMKCLIHANSISSAVEKVLSIEPDHLFRDAWLGFCILDSTRIQLSHKDMVIEQYTFDERELVLRLKVNIRALSTTKSVFPLTEKIYQECLTSIQDAGLTEKVGLSKATFNQRYLFTSSSQVTYMLLPFYLYREGLANTNAIEDFTPEIIKRYPFLVPAPLADSEIWNHIFNATSLAEPRTRESSSGPRNRQSDSSFTSQQVLQSNRSQASLSASLLWTNYVPTEIYPIWPDYEYLMPYNNLRANQATDNGQYLQSLELLADSNDFLMDFNRNVEEAENPSNMLSALPRMDLNQPDSGHS